MATRILIERARARFNHQESRQYLIEKYSNQLHVSYRGGMWTVTTDLINFLRQPTVAEKTTEIIEYIENNTIVKNLLNVMGFDTDNLNSFLEEQCWQ